jgi:hypothetical protein
MEKPADTKNVAFFMIRAKNSRELSSSEKKN